MILGTTNIIFSAIAILIGIFNICLILDLEERRKQNVKER